MFVDWEHDFVDTEDPVPVQVAGADAFAARAGELGVGDGDLVVTYDDYYGIFAARVAWAFRYYGAEARVLDGGWATWTEAGRPVSDGRSEPTPRRSPPAPAAAAAHAGRGPGGASARRDARGRAPAASVPRRAGAADSGHIPGSRCLPYQELVDGATGLWAAPAAVARLARDAGIDPDRRRAS